MLETYISVCGEMFFGLVVLFGLFLIIGMALPVIRFTVCFLISVAERLLPGRTEKRSPSAGMGTCKNDDNNIREPAHEIELDTLERIAIHGKREDS